MKLALLERKTQALNTHITLYANYYIIQLEFLCLSIRMLAEKRLCWQRNNRSSAKKHNRRAEKPNRNSHIMKPLVFNSSFFRRVLYL